MSTELVEFLRAQLAKDEQTAKRAGDSFRQIGETGVIVATDGDRAEECASANWAGVAEHIVRHDPKRVLADIAATRQILEEHAYDPLNGCRKCADGIRWVNDRPVVNPSDWPCRTLQLLALRYASQPGYQEEWRP